MSRFRILFVCTGNTCRSAMAKALFEKMLRDESIEGVEVHSAGTLSSGGSPASEGAFEVCAELGVDLSGHVSTALSSQLVTWADLILCMENYHASTVLQMDPSASPKIHLLGEFGPSEQSLEIPDPVGLPVSHYRVCRDRIRECLQGLLEQMAKTTDRNLVVALGSDAEGFSLKEEIRDRLEDSGIELIDCNEDEAPDPGDLSAGVSVARRVAGRLAQFGVLIEQSGIGMSIIANKVPGARAALCFTPLQAEQARRLFDCNILCLAADSLDAEGALEIVRVWMETRYEEDANSQWASICERLEYGYTR